MKRPHGHVNPRSDGGKMRCGGPRRCETCAAELAEAEAAAPEQIARAFHEAYERLAPAHGYETRPESAVPWEDVPEQNRALMIAVAAELLAAGTIRRPLRTIQVEPAPLHGSEMTLNITPPPSGAAAAVQQAFRELETQELLRPRQRG